MAERVGLVMEYIPGGDLHQYIKRYGVLNEDQARWIFQQVRRATCRAQAYSGACPHSAYRAAFQAIFDGHFDHL